MKGEYARQWNARNRARKKDFAKKYYQENPEKFRRRSRDYKARNRDKTKMANRKSRYNITDENFQAMLSRQGHTCAICKSPSPPCVDHCHKTGRVRGILCRKCNTGIGMLGDSPDLLYAAAAYLKDA